MLHAGSVVKTSTLGKWIVLYMIWSSWVWTPVRWNLGFLVFLSELHFNKRYSILCVCPRFMATANGALNMDHEQKWTCLLTYLNWNQITCPVLISVYSHRLELFRGATMSCPLVLWDKSVGKWKFNLTSIFQYHVTFNHLLLFLLIR